MKSLSAADPTGMDALIPAWVEGVLTPVDKLEVHRRGLRHPAVSVFVLNRGRVLLQRRALGKYHTPGLWANTCCTHPLWGEDALTCANRRLRQELGICGLSPVWRQQVEYRADVGGGLTEHELVDIFVAEAPDALPVTPDPAEVMDLRWQLPADLSADLRHEPERFTPWLRIYLEQHRPSILPA